MSGVPSGRTSGRKCEKERDDESETIGNAHRRPHCRPLFGGAAQAQDLTLGYLPALAGPFATLSRTDEIAAQIAIDEINAGGGIGGKKLKIVSFDTGGKPDQAVVGLNKLAEDDKVLAVIGPFSSGECRVVFPAGERAGIVTMSMASSAPKLAEPFTYALRNTSDEGYMFRNVMKTLQDKKYPVATAAIAYATDDVISKTMGEIVLPNVMKAAGTEIKGSVTFQTQAFDMATAGFAIKGTGDRSGRCRLRTGAGDPARAGDAPARCEEPIGGGLNHR